VANLRLKLFYENTDGKARPTPDGYPEEVLYPEPGGVGKVLTRMMISAAILDEIVARRLKVPRNLVVLCQVCPSDIPHGAYLH